MTKSVVDGRVTFSCQFCNSAPIVGNPEDTLWFSEASVDEDARYRIVIERAVHDPAAKTVPISCDSCGLQYMTMVRVGKNMRTLLVCECGSLRTVRETDSFAPST